MKCDTLRQLTLKKTEEKKTLAAETSASIYHLCIYKGMISFA